MTGTVVKDKTADELGLDTEAVLHGLDLNHVKVEWDTLTLDEEDGIDNNLSQAVGELTVDLGAESGACNVDKQLTVDLNLLLEFVKEVDGKGLGDIESLSDEARVHALRHVTIGLLEELTDEDHGGGGTVSDHLVLSSGGPSDESGSRVLDLLRREDRR